jgi:hypothetical protein
MQMDQQVLQIRVEVEVRQHLLVHPLMAAQAALE